MGIRWTPPVKLFLSPILELGDLKRNLLDQFQAMFVYLPMLYLFDGELLNFLKVNANTINKF